MASTETRDAAEEAAREPKKPSEDLAGLEAGLDALDAVPTRRTSLRDTFVRKVLPPLVAVALVLVVWQVLVWAQVTEEYKLPSPGAVWGEVTDAWYQGRCSATSGPASRAASSASSSRWPSARRWGWWWRG